MDGTKFIRTKLNHLNRRSNPEQLRVELFSCLTYIFLSKEYFKNNKDIVEFNKALQIDLKDYVYKSRTLLVARMNREIQKADKDILLLFLDKTKDIVFKDIPSSQITDKSKKEGSNYIDDLFDQFSRKKDQ